METVEKTGTSQSQKVVNAFIKAINAEDFSTARQYVSDDLKFDGIMGSRDGADDYFGDMKHMKFKYDVKKAFADENDVCLLYDINMGGATIFTCGWYKLENGKISSLKVVFDPRPLLEKK
jgi:limonene-1,2-epoxide hydrolase